MPAAIDMDYSRHQMSRIHSTRLSQAAIIVSIALLTGCVSFSDPVSTGENSYMITARARGGFSSNSKLEEDTVQKAKDYCVSQGLKASIQNAGASGVQGFTPQDTTVIFECLADCKQLFADPALDPIRAKVSLGGAADQTLSMRTDNSKPTVAEKAAIAVWDEKRHECKAGEASPLALRVTPVAGAVMNNGHEELERLIASLYAGEMTYAQFATARSNLLEQATAGTAQALETEKAQNTNAAAALTSAQAQQQAAQAQQQSAIAQENEAQAMQRLSERPVITPPTSFNCQTTGNNTHCQ